MKYQVYRALKIAAERMGRNNYEAQLRAHLKVGRKKSTFRFTVTKEHCEVVKTMPKVLSGEVSPEEAMALLHKYDVMMQRVG